MREFRSFLLGFALGAATLLALAAPTRREAPQMRQAPPDGAQIGRRLETPPIAVLALAVFIVALAAFFVWHSLEQNARTSRVAKALTDGDAERAPALLIRYGCAGCHEMDGIPGADGKVGPALNGLVHRVYIGGTAPNTADNLVRWIVDPQQFSPHSAMPPPGLTPAEARDIAAYLYSH